MANNPSSFSNFFSKISSSVSNWFRRLFGIINPEATDLASASAPVTPISRTPGIKCPECDNHFPVSMEMLLFQGSIQCPYCNLVLNINKEESKKALDPLRTYYEQMKSAEAKAKQSGAKL